MVASDNTPFRFGVNENGEYGYIVTDEEGADSVVPFKKSNYNYVTGSVSASINKNSSYTFNVKFAETLQNKPIKVVASIINGTYSIIQQYPVNITNTGFSVTAKNPNSSNLTYTLSYLAIYEI